MTTKATQLQKNTDAMPAYLFHQGTNFWAYEFLGVHARALADGKTEYTFRTWAPRAKSIEVTGDFNAWQASFKMQRESEGGLWVYRHITDKSFEGMRYKYRVTGENGIRLKADPYCVYAECREHTASIIHTGNYFTFDDGEWMRRRPQLLGTKRSGYYPYPLNIYELHLGSWRTRDGRCTKEGDAYLNYREIAKELAPYCKEMGYTHVELLPVMEHPFDGSWGYQICSYYAPTSRFGTPEDFKFFIEYLHKCGIGVILDWVPAHFPKDAHGLFEFDGSPLYEYQGQDRQEHATWGTRMFDVGRNEVQCFLISNALYWLREFHADGIRVDAVAAMLYLDFDKAPGTWLPNEDGSNLNRQAIAFFKRLNSAVGAEFPDAVMIAEESSDFPGLTHPVSAGGLGFHFKWNMGWAHDIYDYVASDPIYRQYKHAALTFPLMYAFSENYILPVSHDEVVHGKGSLLGKMWGDYEQKFAALRAFQCYMMTQPGKKMMFMGCEYAPFREWDYENELEWFMLDYPAHRNHRLFTAKLNHFYLAHRALWQRDMSWSGFTWLAADQKETNTIAYCRRGAGGAALLIAVNFSPVGRPNYPIKTLGTKPVQVVFHTDDLAFGGKTDVQKIGALVPGRLGKGKEHYVTLDLPGFCAVILEVQPPQLSL